MKPLTISLLACCGFLASVILAEIAYYNPLSSAPILPKADMYYAEASDMSREPKSPLISDLNEITNRPLFSASRRPEMRVSTEPMQSYLLRGALLMGKRRIGLLERRSDGTLIRVHEGDLVDEWRVTSITSETVKIRKSNQTRTMTLTDTLREDLASKVAQSEGNFYEDNVLQGRQQEKDISGNSNLRDDDRERTCLQPECRVTTSENRSMKQVRAALITPPVTPPPPPRPLQSGAPDS